MTAALPEFVEPMLAKLGARPFDSDEHLFEIKWDGIRALAFVEGGGHRLLTRSRRDVTGLYPDLAFLSSLPAGTLLDGELVVLRDGRPDFGAVMAREQAQGALRIASLSRADPVSYVVFDLLYRAFEPVMARPLSARRELLRGLLEGAGGPRLVLSEGVVGAGKRTFAEMGRLGLEGLLAKRLDSSYRPGARTDAWIKVKTTQRIHCAILGYVLDESGGLRSLIVGTDDEGELRCVGKVGSGLGAEMRSRLLAELRARPRPTPLVPTAERGEWVEPGLYCTVTYLERTGDGNLRAPVFEGLVEDG